MWMSIGPPVPEGTEGDGNKNPTKNDGWSTYPLKSGTDVLQTRRDSQCVFLLTQSLVN